MKIYLNGVLVVEGKDDCAYLSNYVASEIVFVNGFELSNRTVEYLKDKHVIALLDPDDSGEIIRERLNKSLTNIDNVSIDINKCTRGNKNGVAECEINEILRVLSPFCINNRDFETDIKENDLFRLGLIGNNKKLRSYVCDKLNLGNCNGKQLLKRLKLNKVSLDDLEKAVEEFNNDNR